MNSLFSKAAIYLLMVGNVALAQSLSIEQMDICTLMTKDGPKRGVLHIDFQERFNFNSQKYGSMDADGSRPFIKFQNGQVVKADMSADSKEPVCVLIKSKLNNPDQTTVDPDDPYSGVAPSFAKQADGKASQKGDPDPPSRTFVYFSGHAGNGMEIACVTAAGKDVLTLDDIQRAFGKNISLTLTKTAIGPSNREVLWSSKRRNGSTPTTDQVPAAVAR